MRTKNNERYIMEYGEVRQQTTTDLIALLQARPDNEPIEFIVLDGNGELVGLEVEKQAEVMVEVSTMFMNFDSGLLTNG